VIAHVAGMPLEELLPLAPGAGALLLFARTWLRQRMWASTLTIVPPGSSTKKR
jgi:hypothetical protein